MQPHGKKGEARKRRASAAFLLGHFSLDGSGSMRDYAEAFLRDKFAGDAADAVGTVLDTDESSLEVLDKLLLASSELGILFLREDITSLVERLEGGSGIVDIVVGASDSSIKKIKVMASLAQLIQNNVFELLQFFSRIAIFLNFISLVIHKSKN